MLKIVSVSLQVIKKLLRPVNESANLQKKSNTKNT